MSTFADEHNPPPDRSNAVFTDEDLKQLAATIAHIAPANPFLQWAKQLQITLGEDDHLLIMPEKWFRLYPSLERYRNTPGVKVTHHVDEVYIFDTRKAQEQFLNRAWFLNSPQLTQIS